MNPVIIVPTYWAETDSFGSFGERGAYDFATPVTKPLPELETCLESLEQVRGVLRTIVLVVAAPAIADSARARVNAICRSHRDLNPLVIGGEECDTVRRAIARISPNLDGEVASLRGYGAIKNMGLAVAAIFGHDSVVFLDDDVTVLDSDYLINAVYALGTRTKQKQLVVAKTGFLLNKAGDEGPFESEDVPWSEHSWSRSTEFNRYIETKLEGPRISRSNTMSGSCCSLYAQAYMNVPFDPFITRGEDLDYVFNLRARGMDVWFDNQWYVRSQPTQLACESRSFEQDIYRWYYELAKIEKSNERRSLRTLTPESFSPYPASWISPEVRSRISQTAFRRMVSSEDRKEYLRIWLYGRRDAERFAQASSKRYLSFAMAWPHLVSTMWDLRALQQRLLRTGTRSLGVDL